MKRIIVLLGLALAVALAVIAGWSLRPGPEKNSAAARPPAFAPAPVPVMDKAPPAAAKAEDGRPRRLAEILADRSSSRDARLAGLLSEWIGKDPRNFRDYMGALGLSENESLAESFYAALPGALPGVDEKAASSIYLAELVVNLIEQNAEDDPRAAAKWAEEWLLDDALDNARAIVAGELARESPEEAIELLGKIRQPLRRIEALGAVGEGYAEKDPAAAAAWAQDLPHDAEVATAMNRVLAVLAESDPEAARVSLGSLQERIARNYDRAVAADRRSRGLFEWPVLDAMGNEVIDDDGGEMVYAAESPDLDLLGDAAATIVHALASDDPASALRLAETLPGRLKTHGRRAAYGAWAEADPASAYEAYRRGGWNDPDSLQDIFSAWAEAEPQTAARIAAQMPQPVERRRAIDSVVETWAMSDGEPSAITKWIDSLPEAADRDAGNRVFVEMLNADQPQVAWSRAVLMKNPDYRGSVLDSAFAALALAEPEAAGSVLARTPGLAEAERERLSRMLPRQAAAR